MKISIKNIENKDINQAVIHFMKVFKNNVYENEKSEDIIKRMIDEKKE